MYKKNIYQSSCDAIQPDFINMLLNGQPLNITATDNIALNNYIQNYSFSGSTSSGTSLSFSMPNINVGTRTLPYFYFSTANQWYPSAKGTYTITQTGSIGEYLAGSFDAKVSTDSTNTNPTTPLIGTFRVRIKQ